MPAPLVTVVIPALQASDNIEACVRSVLGQDVEGGVEVIVVDNGSTDDTVERVRALPVKLIIEPRRGRSAARNHGARIAAGRYLGFIDADCEAPPEWLRRSIAGLDRAWVGAVQARVQKFGQAPPSTEFTQAYYYRPFLDTCALVTTAEAYRHARGYDEELRRNVDMDFSFRLLSCGYAFRWAPSLIVIKHHELTHAQVVRRGWDGGISVSVLARKWPHFSAPTATRAWRDRSLAFARAVGRDARVARQTGGRGALEAALKLVGAFVTDVRGEPVQRERFTLDTRLGRMLGAYRSLVLTETGAMLFDAKAEHIERFDLRETHALCELVDDGASAAEASLVRQGWAGVEAARIVERVRSTLELGKSS